MRPNTLRKDVPRNLRLASSWSLFGMSMARYAEDESLRVVGLDAGMLLQALRTTALRWKTAKSEGEIDGTCRIADH
jgi:hypothetical protein